MTSPPVRPPAVAGSFYPAGPDELRLAVERALDRAAATASRPPPAAVVAPHAGYVYSGPVAAAAWAAVRPLRGTLERVVVLGPAHAVPLDAVAVSGAGAFATPLGPVAVDRAARDDLVAAGLAVVSDAAHAREHSVEAQLPFLQVALGDVPVLPLVVGRAPAEAVVAVLDRVWDGPRTLVVVSTDLSHYHDEGTARRLDRHTAAAVVACRPDAVGPDDACGVHPLRGLLAAAAQRRLVAAQLDLRTSADTAGRADRVVGYGAFAFFPPLGALGGSRPT